MAAQQMVIVVVIVVVIGVVILARVWSIVWMELSSTAMGNALTSVLTKTWLEQSKVKTDILKVLWKTL